MIKRLLVVGFAFLASVHLAPGAEAADRLRIALQKTGTASWEIGVIKAETEKWAKVVEFSGVKLD